MSTENNELTESLKQIYSEYFDSEYINKNLEIPKIYLDSIGKITITDLYELGSIPSTEWGIDLYGDDFLERKTSNRLTEKDKIYLTIGDWGSHHDFHINCDKSSLDFGKIFDYNDAHPWCERHEPEGEWTDFREFLKEEFKIELE